MRQIAENPANQAELDLRKTLLIQKEEGTPGPRLSTLDVRNDGVNDTLERAVVNPDLNKRLVTVPLGKDLSQVAGMVRLNINEVKLQVKVKGLDPLLVQAGKRSSSFLEHDERSAGDFLAFIEKNTAARESVNQVQLENIPRESSTKTVNVAGDIIPENG